MSLPPLPITDGIPHRVVRAGPRSVLGHCGNLMFSISEHSSPRGAQLAHALATELCRLYPQGYGHLVIMGEQHEVPDEAQRTRISALASAFSEHILATAMVLQGDEQYWQTMRLLTRSIGMVVGTRSPRKLFEHVSEASAWIHHKMGEHAQFDLPSLASALDEGHRILGATARSGA